MSPESGMSVRIHRGAREIGGTCIEVESQGRRIVLDAGMPLTTTPPARELLPDVAGMWAPGDGSLLALLLSHTHPDHHGLADLVDDRVPTYLGARASRMRQEASSSCRGGRGCGSPDRSSTAVRSTSDLSR